MGAREGDEKLWLWLQSRLATLSPNHFEQLVEGGPDQCGWFWRVQYTRYKKEVEVLFLGPWADSPREAIRLAISQEERDYDYIYQG